MRESKYAAQRLRDKRIGRALMRPKSRKKKATPPLLRALAEIKELRALVLQGYAVVNEDFMPNIGRCAIQDYGRLNQFLLAARAIAVPLLVEEDYSGSKRPRCPCCMFEVLQGQPCVYARVSDTRVTVLHELCAPVRGADGKTYRECLEEKARAYEAVKRKENPK